MIFVNKKCLSKIILTNTYKIDTKIKKKIEIPEEPPAVFAYEYV